MLRLQYFALFSLVALSFIGCAPEKKNSDAWIELFNGKDLSGWKANENPESFQVVDGIIKANGLRSHLLYTGEVGKANFKNFELQLDVMTYPLANSGVYFHTGFQKEGWLNKGYEMQVNTSHRGAGNYKEVKKGGSLYGIRNVYKAFTKDSVWSTYHLSVVGKHIKIKVDDRLIVDYIEPANFVRVQPEKHLSRGTIALQGHDPESTVFFKNIRIKLLDDHIGDSTENVQDEIGGEIIKHQANHVAFIDTHVVTDDGFAIEPAIKSFYQTGVNLGLVIDTDKLDKNNQEESLLAHIRQYQKYPAFLGIWKNPSLVLEGISSRTLAQFDYVIGGFSQFKNSKGKLIDLKGNDVGNPELFMNDYVKAITDGLNKGEIDIWAYATELPSSLSSSYEKLWTKERMLKVIEAARKNNVAIEINNKHKIPSVAFINLAKEKGCVFSCGDVYSDNKMDKPDYFLQVIDQCKLVYKDIYIPGNPN